MRLLRSFSIAAIGSIGRPLSILSAFLLTAILFSQQRNEPWQRHTVDALPEAVHGIRLKDFNQDGLPDLVVALAEGRQIRIYAHPPNSLVRSVPAWPHTALPAICRPHEVVFADLDNDGASDLLTSCGDRRPTALYVHWGPKWISGQIPAPNPIVHWTYALPFHLKRDSRTHFVVGGKLDFAELSLFSPGANPRDLSQWKGRVLYYPGWLMSLLATDMDGDGDEDLLISDRRGPSSGVFWLEAPGWQRHDIGASTEEVMFIDRADLDGDGLVDVAAAIRPHSIVWFRRLDARGLKWNRNTVPYPANAGTAKGISIGDLNNDGRADIALTCESATEGKEGVWWLEQAKGGFWKTHRISGPQGIRFDRAELLDVDSDGDLDLVTTEEGSRLGIIWYENPFQP